MLLFLNFNLIFFFFFCFSFFLVSNVHFYIFELYLILGLFLLIMYVLFFRLNSFIKTTFFSFFILYLIFSMLFLIEDFFTNIFSIGLQNLYLYSNLKIIILILVLLYLISIRSFFINTIRSVDYLFYISFIIIGSCTLFAFDNLLMIFLSLEIISIASYILVSYNRNSYLSNEAGLKYILLGSISSIFFLLGIAFFYFYFGTVDLILIKKIIALINYDIFNNNNIDFLLFYNTFNKIYIFAGICLCTSLFFKIGAAPFHFWLPDIFEGAITSSSFFLAIVPKLSIFFTLVKMLEIFNIDYNYILIIVYLSLIFGSFLALTQKKTKRFLAYSSITHVGFASLPFLTGISNFSFYAIFYFFHYIIISFILWNFVLNVYNFQSLKIRNLVEFSSVFLLKPILSFCFSIIILSLAGIPPFIGFWVKFFVFLQLISVQYYFLTFFALSISFVAIQYYIKLLKLVYYEDYKISYSNSINKNSLIVLSFFIFFLIFISVFPNFYIDFILFIKNGLIFFDDIAINYFISSYLK